MHVTYRIIDLVDLEGFQRIILVILKAYAPHHSNKIYTGRYIRVINCSFDAKSKWW
jgi:hypothetical protein